MTVQGPLHLLQRDGLVMPQHRRGHFVFKRGLIREPLTELRSVTEFPLSISCLLLEQVHFDREDRLLLWSLDYHRGDVFELHVLCQRLHA